MQNVWPSNTNIRFRLRFLLRSGMLFSIIPHHWPVFWGLIHNLKPGTFEWFIYTNPEERIRKFFLGGYCRIGFYDPDSIFFGKSDHPFQKLRSNPMPSKVFMNKYTWYWPNHLIINTLMHPRVLKFNEVFTGGKSAPGDWLVFIKTKNSGRFILPDHFLHRLFIPIFRFPLFEVSLIKSEIHAPTVSTSSVMPEQPDKFIPIASCQRFYGDLT